MLLVLHSDHVIATPLYSISAFVFFAQITNGRCIHQREEMEGRHGDNEWKQREYEFSSCDEEITEFRFSLFLFLTKLMLQ